jgi:endonuclease
LWQKNSDPAPRYKEDIENNSGEALSAIFADEETEENEGVEGTQEFAFERDLRNYLVKNLGIIERGLRQYEEEGITGIEFPVGGRFIDILALDQGGRYVVIELKVSRGYDRVIGQLLRYMGWVEKNMEPSQPVRGIIVANEITEDLKLATTHIRDVRLVEYKISFQLQAV